MFISPFWSTSLSTGFLLSLLFPLCVSVFQFVQHAPFPLFCSSTQSFLWAPSLPVFWTLHLIGWLSLQCLVHLFLMFIFREWVGREKESKTNINVLLPLAWPILGTWPATKTCALTEIWTCNSLVHRILYTSIVNQYILQTVDWKFTPTLHFKQFKWLPTPQLWDFPDFPDCLQNRGVKLLSPGAMSTSQMPSIVWMLF